LKVKSEKEPFFFFGVFEHSERLRKAPETLMANNCTTILARGCPAKTRQSAWRFTTRMDSDL
jgi:hypothetical protein